MAIQTDACSSVMGARVRGIELSRALDEEALRSLRALLLEHVLLVLPNQDLDAETLLAVGRQLGDLEVHVLSEYHMAGHPEVYLLSNVGGDGETTGAHPDLGTLVWHSDLSFKAVPASFTLLYGHKVPRRDGDTWYANMYRAYESLPRALEDEISNRVAVHDLAYSRSRAGVPDSDEEGTRELAPPVRHPLIRRHPETNRKSLYVGDHCSRIMGLEQSESDALLARLMEHATRPEHLYVHHWNPGDLVIWDNRCSLHRATPYDAAKERRVMYRTVVTGEAVVAA